MTPTTHAPLRHLTELPQRLAHLTANTTVPRVAVVWPSDQETAEAVLHLLTTQKAEVVAVGALHPHLAHMSLTHLHADTPQAAAALAVNEVRQGRADVLMKGQVHSDTLMRAVLHKTDGLMQPHSLLTHIAIIDWERYHKLLFVSDVAVIPEPTLMQRRLQVGYLNQVMQACGINKRKLALIHFNEQVSQRYQLTLDYQILTTESEQGSWEGLTVFGPLDIGTSISTEAATLKGLTHPVCGDTDALLMPTLEAGNVFYKTTTVLGGAAVAGVLLGAQCPIVLNSRADTWQTKCSSLDLALLLHLHHITP